MENVILIIHLIVAVALVGIILLQRSEGGGIVGGSGNMGAMAPRAQADILTKTTGFLATCFVVTSLLLVILANHRDSGSIVDKLAAEAPAAPITAPMTPEKPEPAVPLAK